MTKRERRRGFLALNGDCPPAIEVRDDDPADWDALLAAIDDLSNYVGDDPKARASLLWDVFEKRHNIPVPPGLAVGLTPDEARDELKRIADEMKRIADELDNYTFCDRTANTFIRGWAAELRKLA